MKQAMVFSFQERGMFLLEVLVVPVFFILGMLDIVDPQDLSASLIALRQNILSDPYFSGIPSLQPEQCKTALAFHAKNDIPEVRKEVYKLLHDTSGLRFFAVVTDKLKVLEYVRQRNTRNGNYRYNPNELYDYLVRRLFKERLHKDEGYKIHFATRGKSDRTAALLSALETAKTNFYKKHGIESNATINVVPTNPIETAALQATDYYLWALQRLYERGEDRYVKYLWESFKLVHDIDDRQNASYGTYYSKRNPLSADVLKIKKPEI